VFVVIVAIYFCEQTKDLFNMDIKPENVLCRKLKCINYQQINIEYNWFKAIAFKLTDFGGCIKTNSIQQNTKRNHFNFGTVHYQIEQKQNDFDLGHVAVEQTILSLAALLIDHTFLSMEELNANEFEKNLNGQLKAVQRALEMEDYQKRWNELESILLTDGVNNKLAEDIVSFIANKNLYSISDLIEHSIFYTDYTQNNMNSVAQHYIDTYYKYENGKDCVTNIILKELRIQRLSQQ